MCIFRVRCTNSDVTHSSLCLARPNYSQAHLHKYTIVSFWRTWASLMQNTTRPCLTSTKFQTQILLRPHTNIYKSSPKINSTQAEWHLSPACARHMLSFGARSSNMDIAKIRQYPLCGHVHSINIIFGCKSVFQINNCQLIQWQYSWV